MKMSLKFRSLFMALLMVILISNQPSVILAQQNAVEVQAKRDAEADMNNINNRLSWAGVGGASLLLTAGCVVGLGVGLENHQFFSGLSNDAEILATIGVFGAGTCAAGAAGAGTLYFLTHHYPLTPPPERLIGKTPEYVNAYTDTYKKRTQQLRLGHAVGGMVLLIIAGGLLSSLLVE